MCGDESICSHMYIIILPLTQDSTQVSIKWTSTEIFIIYLALIQVIKDSVGQSKVG